MPEPKKRDPNAPKYLEIIVKDPDGNTWGSIIAREKVFSTGSVGFYAGDKVDNPVSHERYQIGMNVTLIGSKPDNK